MRRFARDSGGNITLFTAVLGLPLMMGAGYAVDLNHVERCRARISSALDAATLAAVKLHIPVAHVESGEAHVGDGVAVVDL